MNLNFTKIEVLVDKEMRQDDFTRIYVEPLEKGFAQTIGTALRRVMLSSLPGTSVVGFRMDGVKHELMTMPGTATDAVDLIYNLKKMKFDVEEDKVYKAMFSSRKAGLYKASDLVLPDGVKLKTPDIDLVNVLGEKEIILEVFISKGRGFVLGRDHELNIDGMIGVDSLFSPIKKIGFKTENIMTGNEEPTHERLILDIETYGNIDAEESVLLAAKIIRSHFDFFGNMQDRLSEYEIYKEKEKEIESINNMSIEELKMSVRSTNALVLADIRTVGKLRKMSEVQLADLKNMGKKSVDEVKKVLDELGVTLGDL